MKIKQHLGISFCDNRIQLAEIDHTKKSAVTVLAEQDSPVDFVSEGASLSASHDGVNTLASALKSMFQKSKASAGHISFALPTNPLFINTIPVDPSLKDEELKEYLKWEVRQYFPDAGATEFINDAHEIPAKDKDARKTFVVSVRRGMVGFLQKVTAQLNLKLQIIDIDHFSSEKTLIANYPEHKKDVVISAKLAALKARHPYETPIILHLPIAEADPDTMAWIMEETRDEAQAPATG